MPLGATAHGRMYIVILETEVEIMKNSKSKLYIAYGSNLNLEQMKRRCPTAEVVGT